MSLSNFPSYPFPHSEVKIHDNSEITISQPSVVDGTKMLFVARTPRGRDGKMTNLTGGIDEMIKKFGMGAFDTYGQPLLNAYTAMSTNTVEAQFLRICAKDAKRANLYFYAAYKINPAKTEPTAAPASMDIQFVSAYDTEMIKPEFITAKAETLKPSIEGYTVEFLFAVSSVGRGEYGNNIAVRFSTFTRYDSANNFKNYTLDVYEKGSIIESFNLCFSSDAIFNDENIFIDNILDSAANKSDNITSFTNENGFHNIIDAYNTSILNTLTDSDITKYATSIGLSDLSVSELKELMTLSYQNFDVLLGINKNLTRRVTDASKALIYNYKIKSTDSTATIPNFQMNELAGIALHGGTEGEFSGDNAVASIKRAYIDAFNPNGITDEDKAADELDGHLRAIDFDIYSTNKYPLNIILDASYDNDIKRAIATLATKRGDCIAFLDIGTGIKSKSDVLVRIASIDASSVNRLNVIDAYEAKVTDPFSRKIVNVSSTYILASMYPLHFDKYNAKHIALAGGSYGIINGVIDGSVFPVFDESIDSRLMSQLYELRVNYAQVNPKNIVTRATQSTRQDIVTNLSEINNMLLVLDIKRDYEELVSKYGYNFMESGDITKFNRDAEQINNKYSATQVKSISAYFSANEDEYDTGTLHLTIDMQCQKLIKTALIDINVNK